MTSKSDPASGPGGCGCVWCDLDVARIKLKRQHVHRRKFKTFVCTRIDHMSYDDKRLSANHREPSLPVLAGH